MNQNIIWRLWRKTMNQNIIWRLWRKTMNHNIIWRLWRRTSEYDVFTKIGKQKKIPVYVFDKNAAVLHEHPRWRTIMSAYCMLCPNCTTLWMNVWLLSNDNSAFIQPCYGENKLLLMRWWWWCRPCIRPTCLVRCW